MFRKIYNIIFCKKSAPVSPHDPNDLEENNGAEINSDISLETIEINNKMSIMARIGEFISQCFGCKKESYKISPSSPDEKLSEKEEEYLSANQASSGEESPEKEEEYLSLNHINAIIDTNAKKQQKTMGTE